MTQARNAEALELLRPALETATAALGEDAEVTWRLAAVTAGCLDDVGRKDEAAALAERVLPRMRAALGPTHEAVAALEEVLSDLRGGGRQ
jgi:hypothetical protein